MTTTTFPRASEIRSRALIEAQAPLLAIVFLLATAATFGVLPAAGMGAGTLVTAWASTRARARRDVVVVGDAEFCSRVGLAAAGRRRIAARYVIDRASAIDALVPETLPECDELMIDGRLLHHLRDRAPHVLDDNKVVRIAPAGVVDGGAFDDALALGNRWVKRALDLTVALVGLVITLPVLLLAMLAIRLDSQGSPIFQQDRLGAGGRRFRLYKLRTMVADNDDSAHQAYVEALIRGEADQNNGVFKLVNDPRITRVGKFLRKTSIDEIPQLWNVVRGEMSLVGPRPPMVSEAALYDDWAWQRLQVKPGLTGLWQVSGRCELSFEDMVALDIEYSRRWSPLLEVQILLKTPKAVLSTRGAA